MNVYAYDAELYCENCSVKIINDLDINVEDSGDSNEYPQGPHSDGGGEADTPQHCGNCGVFLENPLTADGYDYVYEQARNELTDTVKEWVEYYDITEMEYGVGWDDLDDDFLDDYDDDDEDDDEYGVFEELEIAWEAEVPREWDEEDNEEEREDDDDYFVPKRNEIREFFDEDEPDSG